MTREPRAAAEPRAAGPRAAAEPSAAAEPRATGRRRGAISRDRPASGRPRGAPVGSRLLVANLEAEADFARATTAGPHPRLSSSAGRLVGAAATHMALLARDGDRLWLPAPVPPEEYCAAARALQLGIETGPLEKIAPAAAICAWAETEAVASLRRAAAATRPTAGPPASTAAPAPAPPASTAAPAPAAGAAPPAPAAAPAAGRPSAEELAGLAAGESWREALWHLHAEPAVAARANHRGFSLALAQERGWALPGSRMVSDVAALERHLAGGAAMAGLDQAWVIKAPLSAAGRERMRQRGESLGRGERVRIERLLARFGELLFEPWVDRTGDLACAGLVHPAGVRLFPPHRLDNDPRGVFRAALIDDAGAADLRDELTAAAEAAGRALAAAGYLGPFAIDAYTWRDPAGAVRLQRLSEINARLSFGLLARLAAENAGAAAGPFELRL